MANKSFELIAKIVKIGPVQEVSDKFKKREVLAVTEDEYPDYYKFEFIQSKVDVPNDFIEGTWATFYFNLKGRKVEAKKKGDPDMYFTTLTGWKMEA